jgi:CopG family nickel-responsive transcriptional regulator
LTARFSVSFPRNLLEELEKISEVEGLSRSAVLQRASEMYVAQMKWKTSEGNVAGALLIHYNHEVRGLEEKLTDTQHDFLDVIVSSLHVHLTKEECMLVVVVKGDVKRIRELVDEISKLRGIKSWQFSFVNLVT